MVYPNYAVRANGFTLSRVFEQRFVGFRGAGIEEEFYGERYRAYAD